MVTTADIKMQKKIEELEDDLGHCIEALIQIRGKTCKYPDLTAQLTLREIVKPVVCEACDGEKRVLCSAPRCSGGNTWNGAELVYCRVCHGDGEVVCEECGGEGEV